MGLPNEILNQFPPEIQPPMKQMGEWLHDNTIPREDFTFLQAVVLDLSEAQKQTEQRVEELAIAMKEGFQKIYNQISALSGRWGIKNETILRNTISALLSKAGVQPLLIPDAELCWIFIEDT